LTPEQLKQVAQLQPKGPPQHLAVKLQRMQQLAQEIQQSGGDVSDIQKLMQKIGPLLQQGKWEAAEQLIDRALKLRADEARSERGSAGGKEARRESSIELKRSSAETVHAEVAAMKKPDVAWRKIAWRTCLLDGLEESRQQKKPIMLWVFIDRPIDDERC
jgi:hypothetical protein